MVLMERCVQKLWPNLDWVRTWKNLNDVPVPDNTKCIRYQVIHDLIPTNVRLNRINMGPRMLAGDVERQTPWNID